MSLRRGEIRECGLNVDINVAVVKNNRRGGERNSPQSDKSTRSKAVCQKVAEIITRLQGTFPLIEPVNSHCLCANHTGNIHGKPPYHRRLN